MGKRQQNPYPFPCFFTRTAHSSNSSTSAVRVRIEPYRLTFDRPASGSRKEPSLTELFIILSDNSQELDAAWTIASRILLNDYPSYISGGHRGEGVPTLSIGPLNCHYHYTFHNVTPISWLQFSGIRFFTSRTKCAGLQMTSRKHHGILVRQATDPFGARHV